MIACVQEWAQEQFGSVQLGDVRRNRRAVKLAGSLAAQPSASIPKACGNWSDTKAAYELMKHPLVTFERLTRPHHELTRRAAAGCAVVVQLSDTTTLSFSSHPATVGLGPVGTRASGAVGMLLHSTLAVDVSGGIEAVPQVLGLSAGQLWTRTAEAEGQTRQGPDPESSKWPQAIAAWSAALAADPAGSPARGRQVHVGDCESDCWEALQACMDQQVGFAVRACQDRLVLAGHHHEVAAERQMPTTAERRSLFELLGRQPALGGRSLFLRSRPGQAARWARLLVSATAVTLLPPRNWSDKPHRKGLARPAPICCWAVRVWEVDAPEGTEPVQWVILSDQPVKDLADALLVAWWYSLRWLIEEYHKCLKSGCGVEQRQLEAADRLEPLVGMLAVQAVRLLQLKQQAKLQPERAAGEVVPREYVQMLVGARGLAVEVSKLTVRQFWHETAKLGGFLGRKSDGDPGWQTLWLGWHHLDLLVQGARLARKTNRRSG